MSSKFDRHTYLHVGTHRVNHGEVTDNVEHKGGTTEPCGASIVDTDQCEAPRVTRLYVGVTPDVNKGIVTTDPDFRKHRKGATRPIGSTTVRDYSGAELFVVVARDIENNGIVSTHNNHLNQQTKSIGFTVPEK